MKNAGEILTDQLKTFDERGAIYGDNYLRIGPVMAALFPNGCTLTTADDWNRMHLFMMTMVKATRLAVTDLKHFDSAYDAGVYYAMLAGFVAAPTDKTESCYYCGRDCNQATVLPNYFTGTRYFCNEECLSNYDQSRIQKYCCVCGKQADGQYVYGDIHYCSQECANCTAGFKSRIDKIDKNILWPSCATVHVAPLMDVGGPHGPTDADELKINIKYGKCVICQQPQSGSRCFNCQPERDCCKCGNRADVHLARPFDPLYNQHGHYCYACAVGEMRGLENLAALNITVLYKREE
jgi:hypothetical protein